MKAALLPTDSDDGPVEWIGRVLEAAWTVLRLGSPTALHDPDAASVGLGVALLAGVSVVLGQIAVFRINRLRGWRLILGVGIGACANAGLRIIIALLLGLLSWLLDRSPHDPWSLSLAYLFATAPLILGFFAAIPYIGLAISRILEGWSMLALAAMVTTATANPWLALTIAAVAWALGQVLSRLLAHPLSRVASRLWTWISGQPTVTTTNDILAGAPLIPMEKSA